MQEQDHQTPEHHVLVINDGKPRAIALDAAAYSLGRDPSNAIVLDVPTISRQHAILLRLPIPNTNRYRYRLIDGNSEGKRSANGVFVNGKQCTSYELAKGDTIRFGRKVNASYLTVAMGNAEFVKYLESTSFHRLKSEVVDHKATLVGAEMSGPATVLAVSESTTEVSSPSSRVGRSKPNAVVVNSKITTPGDTIPEANIDSIRRRRSDATSLVSRCQSFPRLWMTTIPVVVGLAALTAWQLTSHPFSTDRVESPQPSVEQGQ